MSSSASLTTSSIIKADTISIGSGTLTPGGDVTSTVTFTDTGTLELGSNTLTGSADFAGNSVTISMSGGTITGSVDSTSSSGGILTLSSGTSSITGAIGNSNNLTSVTLSGSASLTTSSIIKADTISLGSGTLTSGGDVTATSVTFTGSGAMDLRANTLTSDLDFAGNNGTINASAILGTISTTTANTGNIILEQGIYGDVGTSAHPLNSVTLSTKSDDTTHSHKIYAKTLNIGSSLGNIFTIDNSDFNVENIYINANDALVIKSNASGSISKSLTGGNASLFITEKPLNSSNFAPSTISIPAIISMGASDIDNSINNTKNSSLLMIGEDTNITTGSITLADNSYIFIANGKNLTATSGSTISLGSGSYITDKIDPSLLTQVNTILSANSIATISQSNGSFTSKYSGILPQIGTSTNSLTNLILDGTSSVTHKLQGNIYALNTVIKQGPVVSLIGNTTILGNITLEDGASINLHNKTLTLTNGDLALTNTMNLAIKLTSKTEYGKIEFTNPSSKAYLAGSVLNLTIDSSSYKLASSDNLKIFSNIDLDPDSTKITDTSNPSVKYTFKNGTLSIIPETKAATVARVTRFTITPTEHNNIKNNISQYKGSITNVAPVFEHIINNIDKASPNLQKFIQTIATLEEQNRGQEARSSIQRIVESNSKIIAQTTSATSSNLLDAIKGRIMGISFMGSMNQTNINNQTTDSAISNKLSFNHQETEPPLQEVVSSGNEEEETYNIADQKYSSWVEVIGSQIKAGATGSDNPFIVNSSTIVAGLDSNISNKLTLGIATALSNYKTKIKGEKNGDIAKAHTVAIGIYGKYDIFQNDIFQNSYIRSSVSYALSEVKQQEKQIDPLNQINYTAIAKYKSQNITGEIGFGANYILDKGNIIINPEISMQQSYSKDNGHDQISDYLPMKIDKKDSQRTDVGISLNIAKQLYIDTTSSNRFCASSTRSNPLVITPSFGIKYSHMLASKEGKISKTLEISDEVQAMSFTNPNPAERAKYQLSLTPSVEIKQGYIQSILSFKTTLAAKYISLSGSVRVVVSL
ncbi:MAG: hypothetical protein EB127_12080 [Alphaproteobacteria bacterium]|nr:hypothetical protein [Alphaproteobacteria bacterium]